MPDSAPCSNCNPGSYQTDRLETWTMAKNALKAEDWDTEQVGPGDVLMLSLFLTGELSGESHTSS